MCNLFLPNTIIVELLNPYPMKHLFSLLAIFFLCSTAHAQQVDQTTIDSHDKAIKEMQRDQKNQKIWNNRAKYLNIGYVKQTLTNQEVEGLELKSDFGASLSWGKTYYLHNKPILRFIKIGLDWSMIDINYAKYSYEAEAGDGFKLQQAEFGMQFGPSVTINPIHHLKIGVYGRVTPSYSLLYYDSDKLCHNYATFFSVGGAVAWRVLSVGVEYRWGAAKYNTMDFDMTNVDLENPSIDSFFGEKEKYKTGSIRVYFGFRF